jgi:rhodanese-related sulfurtransferase
MRQINARELKRLLDSDPSMTLSVPLLLDVRQHWEFDICHIEGSMLIPMGEIHSAIQHLDRDRHTVVICHHGIRSQQVCFYLTEMGFNNVTNLIGGVQAWAAEVDPTMPTY